MSRPAVEVADIFRHRGPAWRASHAGHVSLGQLKVMSAIERCRTAALGGHVERCEACAHLRISYNSCRDRHCPKCQAAAAKEWLADRQAELLPVPYFHVVFTLPRPIADIAYQNKAVVYDLLLKTAAETLITIAADPKHLGARIGLTAVLHTWGSALTHHPHAHIIVPGGGFSPDRRRWIACRPGFFLAVPVLSRLFRRLFLERLTAAYQAGRLEFFADQAALAEPAAFKRRLGALRKVKWVVYAKRPFGGPDAVLAYLSRYTHRIAIANSRLVAFDGERVTFKWKDYRAKADARYKLMTLDADEFIRRFLIHVLPDGFHRIRHYGLFANGGRAENIAQARQLLNIAAPQNAPSDADSTGDSEPQALSHPCPCCGGRMIIIEIFQPGCAPRDRPTVPNRLDSS
ncbi:MAG TPA: IS91 family transposase [Stellaceae bacterium]